MDAVSTSCVFQFSANWSADSVKFRAQNVSFGMLVAPNLAPWGPSSDAGGLGSTRKETLGFRLGFLSIWEGLRSRHLNDFGQFWHNNCVFWHACLQVTFFKDFGV